MKKFSYKALDQIGVTVDGSIEADSVEEAKNVLASRGYIPTSVNAESGGTADPKSFAGMMHRMGGVKTQDLILFTKQFRTLLKAGVPILTLLQVLKNQTQNPRLRGIAESMAQDIREGASLFDAFNKHPTAFSPLYCSMVRAGEASGALPEVLERLSYLIEHDHKIKSDIKSALQYPIMVSIALGIAFLVLLTFVIPKFVSIFKAAGLELPLPTLICMWLYQILIGYWYLFLGVVVAAIGGCTSISRRNRANTSGIRSASGCRSWDRFSSSRRCRVFPASLPSCRPVAYPSWRRSEFFREPSAMLPSPENSRRSGGRWKRVGVLPNR